MVRKLITAKLITDLSALTYESSANLLFTSVKRLFATKPTSVPVCAVSSIGTDIEALDTFTDHVGYRYQLEIYDTVENLANNQSELDIRIDRLTNIEDQVNEYLEAIPNNLEYAISGLHIDRIDVDGVTYDYGTADQGAELLLTIPFTLYCTKHVR